MVIFGIAALGMQPPPEAVEKFGVFQSVSIPKLFIAGVFPGLGDGRQPADHELHHLQEARLSRRG